MNGINKMIANEKRHIGGCYGKTSRACGSENPRDLWSLQKRKNTTDDDLERYSE